MSDGPIIEMNDVSVIFNRGKSNETRSLVDANIKIYPQEYVIIFGPSGCGKSTLLATMAGFQKPSQGDVIIKGRKMSEMKKRDVVAFHQKGMGMVFQSFFLVPTLNILDNVSLPKVFLGEPKSKREERGIELLQRMRIVEQSKKFPQLLSGGQMQRASIARALINDPEIIMADEPVGNLDSEATENVMQILKDLNVIDKKTIILVTHNPEHLNFADRVIHIRDGRIIKEEVFKEKRPEFVVAEKKEVVADMEYVPPDLKILLRTFRNLSPNQIGSLLVSFKTSQLITHILSDFTQDQLDTAEGYLKELLYGNISLDEFKNNLDKDYKKGGAGWNRKRAETFTMRVGNIIRMAKLLEQGNKRSAVESITGYMASMFELEFNEEMRLRFDILIRKRLDNEIDQAELKKKIDQPVSHGGLGIHRMTAEKVAREVEMIMLTKYNV